MAGKKILTRAEQKLNTRKKLIKSTYNIIAMEGLPGVTLAKVANHAGLSRGITTYHFQNKEHLLKETLQFLFDEYDYSWKEIADDNELSPVDKIIAIIKSALLPPLFDADRISVWVAFSAENSTHQEFTEINKIHDDNYFANLEQILEQIGDINNNPFGMSIKEIAKTLVTLFNGFAFNYFITPRKTSPEYAVKACLVFLSGFYSKIEAHVKNIQLL